VDAFVVTKPLQEAGGELERFRNAAHHELGSWEWPHNIKKLEESTFPFFLGIALVLQAVYVKLRWVNSQGGLPLNPRKYFFRF
jgi:hypothetical protein